MSDKPQRYSIGYANGETLPLTMKEDNLGSWVAFSERLTPQEQAVIDKAEAFIKKESFANMRELMIAVKAYQESRVKMVNVMICTECGGENTHMVFADDCYCLDCKKYYVIQESKD